MSAGLRCAPVCGQALASLTDLSHSLLLLLLLLPCRSSARSQRSPLASSAMGTLRRQPADRDAFPEANRRMPDAAGAAAQRPPSAEKKTDAKRSDGGGEGGRSSGELQLPPVPRGVPDAFNASFAVAGRAAGSSDRCAQSHKAWPECKAEDGVVALLVTGALFWFNAGQLIVAECGGIRQRAGGGWGLYSKRMRWEKGKKIVEKEEMLACMFAFFFDLSL